MQTLTAALIELVLAGEVDREVAAGAAPNHHDFVIALEHALKAMRGREEGGGRARRTSCRGCDSPRGAERQRRHDRAHCAAGSPPSGSAPQAPAASRSPR